MTWVAATSRLREDYSGEIKLYRDSPWPTTAWSISDVDDSDWLDTINTGAGLLYDSNQTGFAFLSEGDKLLTIILPSVPNGDFSVTVGSFTKWFNLAENTDGEFIPKLVVAGQIEATWGIQHPYTLYNVTFPGPNLVFFSDAESAIQGGAKSAGLYQDGKQVGFAVGNTFDLVRGGTLATKRLWHHHGGIVFYRFFWLGGTIPTTVEDYTFKLQGVSTRDDKSLSDIEFNVSMSSTVAISPTSNVYDIQPTHRFFLQGDIF